MPDLATNFPSSPEISSVNFRIITPGQTSESLSGKIRRINFGVSYYAFEVKYSNLTPLQAGSITGYLGQALGQQFSFNIILPKISYTKITAASAGGAQTTNTVITSGSSVRGSTSVTLTNCGANKNVLAAGDFFKFNNHSKVYMCVSPCTANSSGIATLFFSCPSVTNIPSSTQLTITAVPFQAILDEPEQQWDTGIGGITSISLSMREVW
jgi:hypothetical protein